MRSRRSQRSCSRQSLHCYIAFVGNCVSGRVSAGGRCRGLCPLAPRAFSRWIGRCFAKRTKSPRKYQCRAGGIAEFRRGFSGGCGFGNSVFGIIPQTALRAAKPLLENDLANEIRNLLRARGASSHPVPVGRCDRVLRAVHAALGQTCSNVQVYNSASSTPRTPGLDVTECYDQPDAAAAVDEDIFLLDEPIVGSETRYEDELAAPGTCALPMVDLRSADPPDWRSLPPEAWRRIH